MLIHPSHQPEARRNLWGIAALGAALLLAYTLPASVKSAAVPEYLTLHAALEIVSIGVAGLIFGVVWSVRRESPQGNFILLATAFLGVGLLDFSHILSADGMPVYITPGSPDKAIYFWLVARALGALALLAVVWLPWRQAKQTLWYWLLPAVLLLVIATHVLYFAYSAALPRLFVPGDGLTRFKVYFEYALIVLYLAAAVQLLWCLHQPRRFNASGLLAAVLILAESGVFFVGYATVSGVYILIGHVYKAIAYVFLYHAVFVETVRRPYLLLQDSRERLRATLDALPDLLFEMDADGRYLDVHASRPEELSATREQLLGRTLREVLPSESAEVALAALAEADRNGVSRGKVIALDVVAGDRRWFELSVSRKAAEVDGDARFVVISRDITERRLAEHELAKLSSVVAQSPVSIIITDLDARIEYVNATFTRTTGYGLEEVRGYNVEDLLGAAATSAATRRELWARLAAGQPWQGEMVNHDKSMREYVVSALVYPLRDPDGNVTHYISHQQDVTAKKLADERIRQLSHYDQLTGLPNRAMVQERFRHAGALGERTALLCIDLDRFKDVNDILGHDVGDLLLQEMSHRLLANLDAKAMLSRQSGDEFLVVAPDADQAAAARLAQTLLAVLSQPAGLAGQELFPSVSIGIALYPDDADGLDALLKNVEIAMYRAKEAGRNNYRFFAPDMQAHAMRMLALGNALKQALQRGELRLAYQPQVVLADGRLVGAEALLRWHSPQWGVVSPGEFIPIAEANGLIVPIGEWVLRTAMDQWRRWREHGLSGISIAVNLSAVQFDQPDLASMIGRMLERTGMPPELLELELTEAVAMKAPDAAARKIDDLARRGIRLAIDDFGTGYSSLSYLKQFRVNKIKIDQSFVRDLGVDPDDQAIVSTIIQMAHGLGMRTIAEGVETAEQRSFLLARGCLEAQGYLFAAAMAPDAFESFAREWQPGLQHGRDAGIELPT